MINKAKVWVRQHMNKSYVFADQALVSGVNFSVGIMLARWLGIETYGLFTLAWMVVLFTAGLQQSFLVAPMYSLSAKQKGSDEWISRLNVIQLIFSIVSFLLSFLIVEISYFFKPEWRVEGMSFIVACLVAVFTLNDFFRRCLFIKLLGKKVFVMDLIGYGLQVVMLFVLKSFDQLTLYSALCGILITHSLSIVFYFLVHQPLFRFSRFRATILTLWQYSRYLLATSVLQWSSGNYFILVAGAMLGPVAVGAVRIVQNLMGLLHVIFLALENLIPVRAASIFNSGGPIALYSYLKNTFQYLLVPILILIALLISFHQEILELLYGEVNEEVYQMLIVFSIVYLMVFIGTLFRFAIRTLEKNHIIFKSYIITTLFSLLLAHYLITQLGAMGVVAGIAGTQLISLVYFYFSLKETFQWRIISFT